MQKTKQAVVYAQMGITLGLKRQEQKESTRGWVQQGQALEQYFWAAVGSNHQ